jgi:hypothetical protein
MDYLKKIKSKKYPLALLSNLFLDSKILGESTWAKPLKSIVLTVIQKFVVLYNYLFAAQFLALTTIIFL